MKTRLILFLFLILPALLFSGCSLLPAAGTDGGPTPTLLPTFSPPTPVSPSSTPAPAAVATPESASASAASPAPESAEAPDTAFYLPQVLMDVEQFPDPAGFQWAEIASGLTRPIGLEHAGDGSGRLFIVEQAGVLRIWQDGRVLPEPFLDIRQRVGSSGNEQGLLGLAFHPRYLENGYFYLNYTDREGNTVIARYRVSADPNRADPATEERLLQVPQPYANHNGGVTSFGPDGYLYLGLGDGGSGGDPLGAGQDRSTLLGKILRIDVDAGEPYATPPTNPFASSDGRPEIWAYGLRNPWRFSFDRLTGDLWIADVGQNSFEEINFQPAGSTGGENYGWNIMEGFSCYGSSDCSQEGLVLPIHDYSTRAEGNCSVTGGYVYRGPLEEWQGIYLYGDFCSGRVWGLLGDNDNGWRNSLLFETSQSISSFGQDPEGQLYLVSIRGSIFRLERNSP